MHGITNISAMSMKSTQQISKIILTSTYSLFIGDK